MRWLLFDQEEYLTTPEAHGWSAANSISQNTAAFNAALANAAANAGASASGRGVVELVPAKTYEVTGVSGAADRSTGCLALLNNVEIRTAGAPTAQASKAIIKLNRNIGPGNGTLHNLAVIVARNKNNWKVGYVRIDGSKHELSNADVDYAKGNNGGLNCLGVQGGTGGRLVAVEAFDGWTDGLWIDRDPDAPEPDFTRDFVAEDCDFHHNRRQGMSIIECGDPAGGDDQLVFTRCKFRDTGDEPGLLGQRPGAGVDIEPNVSSEQIYGLAFYDCEFTDNGPASESNGGNVGSGGGRGFVADLGSFNNVGTTAARIKVVGGTLTGNHTTGSAIALVLRQDGGTSNFTTLDQLLIEGLQCGGGQNMLVQGFPNQSTDRARITNAVIRNNVITAITFQDLVSSGNGIAVSGNVKPGGGATTVTTNGLQTITVS